MTSKSFKFKKFEVFHDKCAMKVGTDAVLLGTWVSLNPSPKSILDIGSGSGILSLMLAQRCSANRINGVEIDKNAFDQCVENFKRSPWKNRLLCYHDDIINFSSNSKLKYDLVISNPPYFIGKSSLICEARNQARFQLKLNFKDLILSVKKLLNNLGKFCVIVPYELEKEFIITAYRYNMFCNNINRVRGREFSSIKRSLIELSFKKTYVKSNEVFLEKERHIYSDYYKSLTKEFYLKI